MKSHSKRAQRIGRLLDARLQVPKGYYVSLYRSMVLSQKWCVELRRRPGNAFDFSGLSSLSAYTLTPRDVLGQPWQVANRLAALLKDDVERLQSQQLAEHLS